MYRSKIVENNIRYILENILNFGDFFESNFAWQKYYLFDINSTFKHLGVSKNKQKYFILM